MKTTNPNTCVNLLGSHFYHLGHILTAQSINQGCFKSCVRLTRKPEAWESKRYITITRASLLYVDHKMVMQDAVDIHFIAQCIFNAVMNRVVGTAFAIRALAFYENSGRIDGGALHAVISTKQRILRHARLRKQAHYRSKRLCAA